MATNARNVVSFNRVRPARTQFQPQPAQINFTATPKDALIAKLIASRADAIANLMFVARTAATLADDLSKLDPELAALLTRAR